MEVVHKCDDPNAIYWWNRFKREVIKKPNYYKTILAWRNKSENFLKLLWMPLFKTKEFCSLYHGQQNIMIKNTYWIKAMSVYGELDPMIEHRTQFAFKGKREYVTKVNMPNMVYPNRHIDIKILHGSRDHVILQHTVNITFNLDIISTDKARGVVKKKVH